jgi:hypothetical protein
MAQAMAMAATWHFNVAFINLSLRDGNAQALASVLQEKNIKCIGIAGESAPPESKGFAAFLRKPIDARDLLLLLK